MWYIVLMRHMDTLKKRLYYQSTHRGMKEMDLVLGGFAERHLAHMTHTALQQFEDLLAFSDQELYGWIFEGTPRPEGVPTQLIAMISDYINTDDLPPSPFLSSSSDPCS